MLRPDNAPSFTAMNDGLGNVFADALTTPTSGAFGLKLYDYNTLKQGGYSDSQIQEAVEGGYAPSLIKLLEPTAAMSGMNQTMIDSVNESYVPYRFEDDYRQQYQSPYYDDDNLQRNTGLESLRQLKMVGPGGIGNPFAIPGGMPTYSAGRGIGTEMQGEYPAMVLPKQTQDIGKFAGIMQATDIDDDQSDEVVEQQNFFQRLMNNSLAGRVGGFLQGIFRPKQSDRYRPATMGIGSFTPKDLNRMNALGGYYSEPARQQRRTQNRIANMIKRRDAGKNYSEKNLANLQAQMSGQPSQAQFATTKAAARSPKVGVSGYTSGDVARESRRGYYG